MKRLAFIVLPLILRAQHPVIIESFASPAFPPAGWDTTRSDSAMAYWVRYPTSGANPDSHHARVQVYNRYDTLRQGFSDLITRPLDLSGASGVETLSFWFRFSVTAPNLGPDDSLSLSISEDSVTWDRLWTIGQSDQSNVWAVVERSLAPYDHYPAARFRFRFEDRPNGSLGNTNRFFWLDSVKVVSYGVGIEEAKADSETFRLMICPNPARNRVELNFHPGKEHRAPLGGSGASTQDFQTKSIELKIYDITGRLVRSFALCSLPIALCWDGSDQSGRRLPAGVYCCELAAGGRHERRMLILVQ